MRNLHGVIRMAAWDLSPAVTPLPSMEACCETTPDWNQKKKHSLLMSELHATKHALRHRQDGDVAFKQVLRILNKNSIKQKFPWPC